MTNATQRGIRSAQLGMLINAVLAITKLVAGLVGNTYALVADAVESTLDIFSSFIVWAGLAIAARPADADHPYGHGKAESVAAVGVSFMLIGAAIGIALQAVREILTPHKTPAPWTLGVLVGVMVIKWVLSRRVHAVGAEIGSTAVRADAWHHMSDALTSAAAFVGISVALVGSRLGGGSGWASADDWAALFASAVIAFNGIAMLQPALNDLMDRMPGEEIVGPVQRAVRSVSGVLATEKLGVRKAGMTYLVTIHVQADPSLSLHDAHILAGKVKSAIRAAVPQVESVLVHMEPFEEPQVMVDASATRMERD
ncbi:MAG TPA: cation diffusion facilitator family transporter [Gemmatimonadaceae bacterium]|nr:cation diffusion facilitator family transporter [Gemmatimonadaceae bacterium]